MTRLFDHALIDGDKVYSNASKDSHMTSTRTIERANFQNSPLLNLLLQLSVAFKVLYIAPPRREKIGPPGKMAKQTEESYQTELENYNEELKFLNSDEDSNWMEVYFEDALRFSNDEWGRTAFKLNEMEYPAITNTKRKYTDMTSSNLRYNQGGDFLPEADEGQDVIMNEGEDYDDFYKSSGETREENNQASSSRRRLN